jgi:hypothetical protein
MLFFFVTFENFFFIIQYFCNKKVNKLKKEGKNLDGFTDKKFNCEVTFYSKEEAKCRKP